jgi:hypothetical protein
VLLTVLNSWRQSVPAYGRRVDSGREGGDSGIEGADPVDDDDDDDEKPVKPT